MATPIIIPSGTPESPRQRFIRTFESDAAALKGGGTPGLNRVDIKEAVDTPEDLPPRPVPLKKEPETPLPPPPPIKIELPPPPPPKPLPPPPPPVPAPCPPPPPPPKKVPVPPIHTFSSDFRDRIKETKASTTTILAAEQDAAIPYVVRPRSSSSLYIVGGIALLILGAGSGYAAYTFLSTPGTVFLQPSVSTPIFVNERETVAGKGEALSSAITASVDKPLAEGTIRLLYMGVATSTGGDVFHALRLPAPDILLRNVVPEGSMAGVENVGGSSAPFFILKVSSYGDTFAGMLTWEPRMGIDLRTLYPSASSTPGAAPLFKDKVVANHDARVFTDGGGTGVITYGYWNPTTLVIAKDEEAFALIIERLSTSKTQR